MDPAEIVSSLDIQSSGRWHVSLRDLSVRPYPFPFNSALAICNENTFDRTALFEEAHAFVNGNGVTAYGDALALEVGDSARLLPDGEAALGGDEPASCRVADLVAAGWIDSLCPATSPPLMGGVSPAEEFLANHPLPIVLSSVVSGEERGLARLGVRYFGDSELIEVDKFGDHYDYKLSERFHAAAAIYDWRQWDEWLSDPDRRADSAALVALMNETLIADPASRALRFKRYDGPWRPSMPTFSAQATSVLLDQLATFSGVAIIRQRFGDWSLVGSGSQSDGLRSNNSPVFDRHAIAAWNDIADRVRSGRLWVATTSRVLDHLWRRGALRFSLEKLQDKWVVTLIDLSCPMLGRRTIEEADLNGLAFTVGEATPEVIVAVAGWARALEMTRTPDPVHRYRHAVHLPWRSLEWIAPPPSRL